MIIDKSFIKTQKCEQKEELYRLSREEIVDDCIVVKINKAYYDGISAQELYEVTRGIWKRKIESVVRARYCLSVYKGEVIQVFKIAQWHQAGTTDYFTRELIASHCPGRIEFTGVVADDEVRSRYVGKSVAALFKNGEANPVKTFFKE